MATSLKSRVAKWITAGEQIKRDLSHEGPSLIQDNMDNGFSLRQQAAACGCAASYLSKVLNCETTISPGMYVQLATVSPRRKRQRR